ncbi:MAG: penicillin acylase family protein [Spirochaetes bacterium]|nr:penicillin acylase family protein [Spirochaetota bacterium]
MKKKAIYVTFSLSVVIVVSIALLLIWYFQVKETVSYDEILHAEVLAPITVLRDENGIPLIRAEKIEDALLALGYVHAQDGIIIADYYRAIANGMLSARIGEKALVIDKLSRTLNFRGKAERIFREFEKRYSSYFIAYTKGLNLFLKRNYHDIAAVSNISNVEWVAEDSIAILLMLDWCFSFLQNRELVYIFKNQNLRNEVKKIFPSWLIGGYDENEKNNIFLLKELQKTVQKYVGLFNRGFAFYIPESITADEKSAFAFNAESLANIYPVWYPVRIEVKGKSVIGLTAVGLPYIFSGRNEKFSFAGFNLSIDVQDFYREITRKKGQGTECLIRGRWIEVPFKDEKIEIRKDEAISDTTAYQVRWKEDCPIISDVFKGKLPSDIISVKGIEPSQEYFKFLFDLPFAEGLSHAHRMFTNVISIPKVYLLATNEKGILAFLGAISRRNIGNVILRGDLYYGYEPTVPIGAYFSEERGKQLVVGSEMLAVLPPVLQHRKVFNDTWRYERINELIRERSAQPHLIKDILHDTESQIAKKFTPIYSSLLDKIPIPSAKLSKIYFKNWDYFAQKDSVPSAIMNVVLNRFFFETIYDELGDDAYHALEHYYWAMENFAQIAKDENSPVFDDLKTEDRVETRSMIFDRAFIYALKFLNESFGPYMNQWKWGRLHKAKLQIPLLRKESLVRKEFMKTYLYKISGDDSTIFNAPVDMNNRYRAKSVTAFSVAFYNGAFISRVAGISMNPLSEFSKFYMNNRYFVEFDSNSIKHEMKILPIK